MESLKNVHQKLFVSHVCHLPFNNCLPKCTEEPVVVKRSGPCMKLTSPQQLKTLVISVHCILITVQSPQTFGNPKPLILSILINVELLNPLQQFADHSNHAYFW